jgi:IS30 family transposase
MVQSKNNVYKHLNQEQRVEIYAFLREWLSYREIWRRLEVAHTTISREVKRNSVDKWWWVYKYWPIEAERLYKERRNKANFRHIKIWKDNRLREQIEKILISKKQRWPDEILWRLKLEWYNVVSTASLYRFIHYDKPIRARYLRYKQGWYKTKNKWNKRKKMYQDVPNIKDRPEIINERWRIWDFEWDTVISGHKYSWWLTTLADRMSRYYLLKKVGNFKANTINLTITAMLQWEKVKSITFDNWVEFSGISELQRSCFRADSYSSWQRWTNERHNWFLRRFIPKWVDINKWTDEEISTIQDTINNKPRKILGYKTPYEVYHNINLTYIK